MDRIRAAINRANPEEPVEEDRTGVLNELADVTTLSWETRIYCFSFLLVLGLVVTLLVRPLK